MDYDSPTTERQKKAVNQAKKIFLLLLAGGLSIGVVVSIGVAVSCCCCCCFVAVVAAV